MTKKTLEKMIGQLEDAVKHHDDEMAHSFYDTIAFAIARIHEPKLMRKMDRITKDSAFWYA
jgi:hypothetical protein